MEDHNIRNVKYRKNRSGKTGKRLSETYVVLNRWLTSSSASWDSNLAAFEEYDSCSCNKTFVYYKPYTNRKEKLSWSWVTRNINHTWSTKKPLNLFYVFTISVYYILFFSVIVMLVYCEEFWSLHATLWSLYLTWRSLVRQRTGYAIVTNHICVIMCIYSG